MFRKDMVLSKMKHPSQKLGNNLLSSFSFITDSSSTSNFPTFTSLISGCYAWQKMYDMRNTTTDWIQADPDTGPSVLEEGPEDCQDRRGKWFRRQLLSLQVLPRGNKKSSKGRSRLKVISRFPFRWTSVVVFFWIAYNPTRIPSHVKGYSTIVLQFLRSVQLFLCLVVTVNNM